MSKMIPFGKYKGQPIEVLENDPEYAEWIARQDWAKERFPQIVNVIINKFGENEETPEHNAMQAKFMSREYCLLAADVLGMLDMVDSPAISVEDVIRYRLLEGSKPVRVLDCGFQNCGFREHPYESLADLIVRQEFEVGSIDVQFHIGQAGTWRGNSWVDVLMSDQLAHSPFFRHGFRIELKPAIGDDYPAVLRQMRNNHSNTLIYGHYTGSGVTESVFREFFTMQGIAVTSTDEIEHDVDRRLQEKTAKAEGIIAQQADIFKEAARRIAQQSKNPATQGGSPTVTPTVTPTSENATLLEKWAEKFSP